MDWVYLVTGSFLCWLFITATSTGGYVINLYGNGATRPTGPGAHYHK